MDYWIAIDKKKTGPLTLADVRAMHLSPDTLVWHNGLSTWTTAGSLPELAGYLAVVPKEVTETIEVTVKLPNDADTTPDNPTLPRSERPIPPIRTYVMPPVQAAASSGKIPTPPPPMPRSYIGWSIAAIILCCTIPAIVSLIFSTRVAPRYNHGDYEGARKASEMAEIWLIVAIVFGLVALPFSFVLNLL